MTSRPLEPPVGRIARALEGEPRASRRWLRAPGRVNLMGDHTDYNLGLVLPMAIDLECVIAVRPSSDGRIRVRSLDVPEAESVVEVAADGSDDPRAVSPPWGRYVAGVVRALAEAGDLASGLDAVLASNVPQGSGLSSSAAIEVACALACREVAGGRSLSPLELARVCQRAEHLATGVACGIMDPLVSVAGRDGHAMRIDCRTLAVESVLLPDAFAVGIVHSGISRRLADSEYTERRRECERIAAAFGRKSLRDVPLADAASHPYSRHAATENERVLATGRALAARDESSLGRLFAESHASLRDDYRVSTPELDRLVERLVECGAIGARPTGAGFGGAVVALTRAADAESVLAEAAARYARETKLQPLAFRCRAVGGAGPLAV